MNTSKKRLTLVSVTVAGVLLGGGIAAAYWTTTGSGTGTARVGTDAGVTVVQDSTVTGLVPGGAAQPIDFTVTNSSATAPVQISNVVIGFGSFAAGCSAADFTLTQPSKPSVGTPLAITAAGSLSFTSGGAGATGATGAAIAMNNTGSNQDACKLSTVNLTYTVS
jgi:hypothetical protein